MTADSFAALLDEPRWLAWRTEERRGKPTKVPYSPHGGPGKSNDPATWGTHAQAAARAAQWNGNSGCGVVLGDIGDQLYLAGLDLDSSLDEGGQLAPWAGDILAAIGSYAEISPSGRGLKVFFYIETDAVRPFLAQIGVDVGQSGTKRGIPGLSGADHGPGVELYCSHRFFTVTGRTWSTDHPRIVVLDRDQLAALAALVPTPRTGPGRNRTGAGGDTSRSAKALGIARKWYRPGATFEALCAYLRDHSDGEIAAWVRVKGEAAGGRELRRIWARLSKQDEGLDDDAEIARLARLKIVAYEREREAAAEKLGMRVSILDRLARQERGSNGDNGGQGRPLELAAIAPWPDPVDGAGLLDAIAAAVRRHIVLESIEADAAALWIVGTHQFDRFAIFPRLFITAAEKGSGKSTLLDVLKFLVERPKLVENTTAAALFRTINLLKPTLLLDEAESYARENEELRGIINAGHRADGTVIRTVGDNFEPREFDVFSPMALAAICNLPGTIVDRAIIIRLRRRRRDEEIAPLRCDRPNPELESLARQAARWGADHRHELATADPAVPPTIFNRLADNWRPLLAIAELAGGEWPRRACNAALSLAGAAGDGDSFRVQLLADIRNAFAAKGTDRLSSQELADYLASLEDRPWPEWGRARKPITTVQIARLLKPLRISPGTIRLGDYTTPKGYYRSNFEDAFARYLSQDTPF